MSWLIHQVMYRKARELFGNNPFRPCDLFFHFHAEACGMKALDTLCEKGMFRCLGDNRYVALATHEKSPHG